MPEFFLKKSVILMLHFGRVCVFYIDKYKSKKKMKRFCELCLMMLMVSAVLACKNDQASNMKDGAVVVSGDLTYDKLMDALSPFVKGNEGTKESAAADGYVKKTIQIDKNLRKIDASSVIDVIFTQSDEVSARMVVPEKWSRYFYMKYGDGCLEAGVEESSKLSNHNGEWNERVKLYVSAPSLSVLSLSGASSAQIDHFKLESDLMLDCSGASNIAIKSVNGHGALKLDFSGASNFAVENVAVNVVKADVCGASHISLGHAEAEEINEDISGCSNVSVAGRFNKVMVDVSGASKSTVKGEAKKATVSASGVSKINIKDLICSNVSEDSSGMSRIEK